MNRIWPSSSPLSPDPTRGHIQRVPPVSDRVPTRMRLAVSAHPGALCGGFTLIELLLAVAIFAVVLLAIQTVFSNTLRLRDRAVTQLEAAVPLERALDILRRDLANLVPPAGTFSGPFQSVSSAGGGWGASAHTSSNAIRANLPGRVVSPDLYTTTGIMDDWNPWGEIRRVTYYLADATNHQPGYDLIRAVARNLLPVFEDQVDHEWLLGGVDNMVFLYFDGLNWIEHWDSTTAATPLPAAVKIQLWLADEPPVSRANSRPIELVVPSFVQAATNQTSSTVEAEL